MRGARALFLAAAVLCACSFPGAFPLSCIGPGRPPVYEPFRTASGVEIQDILVPESGRRARIGDVVTIDYELRLEDGTIVDSSRDRGQPIRFALVAGELPQGLVEGIAGMIERGARRIVVPPEQGYGSEGLPPLVPPHALLRFEVDLLEIEPEVETGAGGETEPGDG